jgi:hypothetical protein
VHGGVDVVVDLLMEVYPVREIDCSWDVCGTVRRVAS